MEIIVRSPDPFFYAGGETGVLLIHGFTGTPSELRPMGKYFQERGYTVMAPLLAGHGLTPEEMAKTTWHDWWESVLTAYEKLSKHVEKTFAVGFSMGGTLALYLAAQRPLTGLVSLCAPIWVQDWRAHIVDLVRFFKPFHPRKHKKPPEIEQHLVIYDRIPLGCVSSLNRLIKVVRRQLAKITTPALIIQSKKDETVKPESASFIYQHLGTKDKKLSWYEKSSHMITLDRERRKLFKEVEEFIIRTS